MVVNRRTVLKQLAIVSAGIALSPSLVGCSSKPSLLFKTIKITKDEEELLKLFADTIIPKTDTPGAIEVNAHLYSAKMIDDCMEKKDQAKWLTGLRKFATSADEKAGGGFASMNKDERENFLTQFEEKKFTDADLVFFYDTTKYLTIRGYTTSEYYLTKQGFSLIPGRFQGCVAVSTLS
jgi:hypothetical protein